MGRGGGMRPPPLMTMLLKSGFVFHNRNHIDLLCIELEYLSFCTRYRRQVLVKSLASYVSSEI